MTLELLRRPDPGHVADTASVTDVLRALRECTAEDGWPDESCQLMDYVLTAWAADLAGRPDDREGIAELQRLIDYAVNRARNRSALPPDTRARWLGFKDVLEARRRTIAGRAPALILDRRHVRDILAAIGRDGSTQQEVSAALGNPVLPSRLSQLLSLMEAHGLLTRKREGRENRLALTESGRKALPDTDPGRNASPSSTRPLRSKLAA